MEVLALPVERPVPNGHRLDDEVVRLPEAVHDPDRVGVRGRKLIGHALDKPHVEPTARNNVDGRQFFGGAGAVLWLAGVVPAIWAGIQFSQTGSLPVLSCLIGATLLAAGTASMTVGLVLHSIARRFQELDHQIQTLADDLRSDDPR